MGNGRPICWCEVYARSHQELGFFRTEQRSNEEHQHHPQSHTTAHGKTHPASDFSAERDSPTTNPTVNPAPQPALPSSANLCTRLLELIVVDKVCVDDGAACEATADLRTNWRESYAD